MSKCPYTWFKNLISSNITPSGNLATNLRVTVFYGDEEKVNVSLPARSAKWLMTLIPDGVLEAIKQEGIPIEDIQKNLNEQKDLYPQGIFYSLNGSKKIDVWLE